LSGAKGSKDNEKRIERNGEDRDRRRGKKGRHVPRESGDPAQPLIFQGISDLEEISAMRRRFSMAEFGMKS
jgi:hypothetical protein